MMKTLVFSSIVSALAIAFAPAASAALFTTSNGDMEISSPQTIGDPPILNIKSFSGAGGSSYTNQVSGAAFTPFGEIRTVSGYVATTALNGIQVPITFSDGDLLVVVSVLRGTIVSGPGFTSASFDLGRAFALKVSAAAGAFDPEDPSTWAPELVIAEYALAPKGDVIPGPLGSASQVAFSASQVNFSSVNSVSLQTTQGQFLFVEDSTAAENGLVILGSPFYGNDFIRNVDDFSPPGLSKDREGIFAEIDQTLLFQGNTLDGADLAVMNTYFGSLGIGTWATSVGGGGAGTDYTPVFGATPSGDFQASFGVDNHLGHTITPEPSSIAMFGLALVVGLTRVPWRRFAKR